jgi:hypothetical protein
MAAASSSTGGPNNNDTAAASTAGHKRAREPEISPNCCCTVCFEVLLDPITLPCGHALDKLCLQQVMDAASRGVGQRKCPTCRQPLPAEMPSVSVQLRDMVQERYPQQVPMCPKPQCSSASCLQLVVLLRFKYPFTPLEPWRLPQGTVEKALGG